MNDRARAWLAMRTGTVPPALEARMESALADVPGDDSVPAALADAARACLRDAVAGCDDRDAALHLLAADALITCACEAAADEDAAALDALAQAHAPERLAHLVERNGTS
jgi:hypothetical protein